MSRLSTTTAAGRTRPDEKVDGDASRARRPYRGDAWHWGAVPADTTDRAEDHGAAVFHVGDGVRRRWLRPPARPSPAVRYADGDVLVVTDTGPVLRYGPNDTTPAVVVNVGAPVRRVEFLPEMSIVEVPGAVRMYARRTLRRLRRRG